MQHRFSLNTAAALALFSSAVYAQSGTETTAASAGKGAAATSSKTGESAESRDLRMRRFYKVTQVKGPDGVDPQVGGLAVLKDGRLVAAFHRGEVAILDPEKQAWSIFAEGLHEPLGVLEENDGSLLVMQRPELTRLRDTTGSGKADVYETFWNEFGMSGNYHEFAFGPVRAPSGKLYVGLNLASSGDTIHEEIRGKWMPVGMDRKDFYKDWKVNGKNAGRMYSRVPWRGWVMELDPVTRKAAPFASGFRSPDGLGFDSAGHLLVSDNQGDWRGSSELHVVQKGGFYGHPASLPWTTGWGNEAPLDVPIEKLNELRTPAAVWFPHLSYANSPTQMVSIPKTSAWGPYGGQLVIGEMNVPKLLRVTLEEVNGMWQGGCYPFVEMSDLKAGLHRLAFRGDQLWLGRTHLTWAGAENLGFVEPVGAAPMDALSINLTKEGFKVRFTRPLAASTTDVLLWKIRRYAYAYHKEYGSPELNQETLTPTAVVLSADGLTAELTMPELHENFVYDFYLEKLRAEDGEAPLNVRAAYTLRRKF
ncbi:MAG: PQQ-dependent sugar dehydrogenase [Verrucomicrobiota bacterium]